MDPAQLIGYELNDHRSTFNKQTLIIDLMDCVFFHKSYPTLIIVLTFYFTHFPSVGRNFEKTICLKWISFNYIEASLFYKSFSTVLKSYVRLIEKWSILKFTVVICC